MATTSRVWISPQAHERLHRELDTLRFLFSAGIADETDGNAMAVRRAWEVRMQQVHDLLINAVVGEDPPDDGIAEPGMVVTVRYDATGDTDTFLLGVQGAEFADMPVRSIDSPLGAAIEGARPGERRVYRLAVGAAVPVTLLKAVPYGLHAADLTSPRQRDLIGRQVMEVQDVSRKPDIGAAPDRRGGMAHRRGPALA
jgi:transcription elongation GreA/GreB family factor